VTVEHALGIGVGDELAFEPRLHREPDKIGAAILPARATIAAAHHAIDFDRRVKILRLMRIERDAHDTARKGHLRPLGEDGPRQESPMLAAIVAAIDRDRRRAGEDRARLFRVDEDRPDLHAAVGKIGPVPMIAAIGAVIGPVLRAGEDQLGILRMDDDRMDADGIRQPIFQMLPLPFAHGLAEGAGDRSAAPGSGAGKNIRSSHRTAPVFASPWVRADYEALPPSSALR
jgi:hypothetical protein